MWKRISLFLSLPALAFGALAFLLPARSDEAPAGKEPAPPKSATSRIVHVTIYPNSALVTREVDVPAGTGSCELVVTPLPQHTVNSSLYSEGTDGIRVLTTRFRMRPVKEDTREEVRKLEDELKKLNQTTQRLQADIATSQQNTALLGKLENFTTASTQSATEKGKLDSDTTIALAKFLMDGRGEKSKEQVALQQQLQDNQEQIQFAQRQLTDLTAGSNKTERDAIIVVDNPRGSAGKVRLNYLVDAASWRPQYKLRAGKEVKESVQVEYLAAITQQTGEDWRNVDMVLSTAKPMLNAAPPELKMLALAVVPRDSQLAAGKDSKPSLAGTIPAPNSAEMPAFDRIAGGGAGPGSDVKKLADEYTKNAEIVRGKAQSEVNLGNSIEGNKFFNDAAAWEQARDLVVSATEKPLTRGMLARTGKNEGPSVIYHLPARLAVPSRNDEQVIEVARLDLAPEYFYKAVPVLTRHVYRQANLTNTSKYVLLPGEATMYTGTDFVGRMDLPLVAVGEQFTAGFGVEPQLQVQRQMVDKSRTMQGGNQVLKYEYRILVSSYKPERVKLQVWDRLPHAENETVGVSLMKATPEISKDPLYVREEKPNNLLRWDVDVEPAMNGEKALTLQYEFKMELDRQMTIGNFATR